LSRSTLRTESKSPAPAIFFKSSKVELDLTATSDPLICLSESYIIPATAFRAGGSV